jgi:hypothetical protein
MPYPWGSKHVLGMVHWVWGYHGFRTWLEPQINLELNGTASPRYAMATCDWRIHCFWIPKARNGWQQTIDHIKLGFLLIDAPITYNIYIIYIITPVSDIKKMELMIPLRLWTDSTDDHWWFVQSLALQDPQTGQQGSKVKYQWTHKWLALLSIKPSILGGLNNLHACPHAWWLKVSCFASYFHGSERLVQHD